MAPRFLLTLNVLDEFGFVPMIDKEGRYQGTPQAAHYPLFETVISQLGVSDTYRANFAPSQEAQRMRSFVESFYSDYLALLAILLVGEEHAILISPPMRRAVAAVGVNVDASYYVVHGSQEECDTARDDDHQRDVATLLAQAMTPKDYETVRKTSLQMIEILHQFWLRQLQMLPSD